MLVLSRKNEEEIYIGDIMIKVVEISKNNIRLGIDAPKDVAILRGELKKSIEDTNKEASQKTSENELKALSGLLKK